MSTVVWEVAKKIWCDAMRQEAELLEERVYPDERLLAVGAPYRVRARKCSLGIECNLAGYDCRWAATNPDYDPFAAK
ncbi:MAG: hypothetical protein HY784_12740 [Chloroflexi bacterium]|nr:hypothetical protein [Chloroflexota bacterium]